MSRRVKGVLTSAHIKTLLTRIGSGLAGTKPELTQRLQLDLRVPKLQDGPKTSRILSVDMGIRNMAFCVCDVEINSKPTSTEPPVKLDVVAWQRISVSDPAAQEHSAKGEDAESLLTGGKESFHPSTFARTAYALLKRELLPFAPHTILIEQQRYRSTSSAAIQEWTYRVNMLEGMMWAVLETLKQEQRSSLHTNNDEAHQTVSKGAEYDYERALREDAFPAAFPVSPARVATFWMDNSGIGRALRRTALSTPRATKRRSSSAIEEAEEEDEGEVDEADEGTATTKGKIKEKKPSRSKVEKKMKIQLVEHWLRQNLEDAAAAPPIASAPRTPTRTAAAPHTHRPAPSTSSDIHLAFPSPQALSTRDAFLARLSGSGRTRAARGSAGSKSTSKKAATASRPSEQPVGLPGSETHDEAVQPPQPHLAPTTTTTGAAGVNAAAAAAGAPISKLDDLADCLLQAAAWAQWEANRRALLGLDEGRLKEVAEETPAAH